MSGMATVVVDEHGRLHLHPAHSARARDSHPLYILGNDYDSGMEELCGHDDTGCAHIHIPEGWWLSVNGDIGPTVGTKASLHKGPLDERGEYIMPAAVGPAVVDQERLQGLMGLWEAAGSLRGGGMTLPEAVALLALAWDAEEQRERFRAPPAGMQDLLGVGAPDAGASR